MRSLLGYLAVIGLGIGICGTTVLAQTDGKVELNAGKDKQKKTPATEEAYYKGSNPFKDAMGKAHIAFAQKGYHLWCPSVIKVGDTYHMFVSRWADKDFYDWKYSHIARATSKSLLGPYTFQEIVLEAREGKGFNTRGLHNPKIMKVGDKYVLYYICTSGYQTGIATADSIDGPWTRSEKPIIPTNNPALVQNPDGSFYGVGRKKLKGPNGEKLNALEAFRSKNLLGPYVKLPVENALPDGCWHEDTVIWYANNQYNIIVTDFGGKATGIFKAFIYYYSRADDGEKYRMFSDKIILDRNEPVEFADGSEVEFARIERPCIFLNDESQVEALMLSAVYPGKTKDGRIKATEIIMYPIDKFIPENTE